jgi:hypothetical protein
MCKTEKMGHRLDLKNKGNQAMSMRERNKRDNMAVLKEGVNQNSFKDSSSVLTPNDLIGDYSSTGDMHSEYNASVPQNFHTNFISQSL